MIAEAISKEVIWTHAATLTVYEHECNRYWAGVEIKNAAPDGGDVLLFASRTYDRKEYAEEAAMDWIREQANGV